MWCVCYVNDSDLDDDAEGDMTGHGKVSLSVVVLL